eukprot:5214235-Pyramimonas_sp.AAC.1
MSQAIEASLKGAKNDPMQQALTAPIESARAEGVELDGGPNPDAAPSGIYREQDSEDAFMTGNMHADGTQQEYPTQELQELREERAGFRDRLAQLEEDERRSPAIAHSSAGRRGSQGSRGPRESAGRPRRGDGKG